MSAGFLLKTAGHYFKDRLTAYPTGAEDRLDTWLRRLQLCTYKKLVETYLTIMGEVKAQVVELIHDDKVNWDKLPDELSDKYLLWFYRESIVALSFYTGSRLFTVDGSIVIGGSPVRQLSVSEGYAIILGSVSLTSDIDVSIKAGNASVIIAVIEDLWLATKWFDHSLWKVDLYGDFNMIGTYYMDTRYFSKETELDMLRLAIVSYFRHEKSAKFNTKLLMILVKWYISDQGLFVEDVDRLVLEAKSIARVVTSSDRETYYKKLGEAELLEAQIAGLFDKRVISKRLNKLLGECVVKISESNLYREENYVLVPTVIHIVKIEQGKESKKGTCPPLLTTIAKCSLSKSVYILSMIEQLGYLQEKEAELRLSCSLGGGKYFGRFLRGLQMAVSDVGESAVMEYKGDFKQLLGLVEDLDKLKKSRGLAGNIDMSCEDDIDLYGLLVDLFKSDGMHQP